MSSPADHKRVSRALSSPADRRLAGVGSDDAAVATRRRLFRNSVALAASQLVFRFMSTLATLVVAHALGPALFGEITLAQTLAAFFGGVGDAGLTLWVYREIVLAPRRLWQLVVDTTALQLALALVLGGAIVLIALLAPMPSGSARLLLLFAPFLITEALSVEYALRAFERMAAVAIIRIVGQAITSIGTIALVLATHDAIWVPIMLWVGQLAADALVWWALRAGQPFERVRPRLASTGRLLRAGAPMLVTVVLINLWGVASTVSLAALRGSRALGLYSAPFGLIFTAWLMAEVAVGGVFPEFVRRQRDDHAGFAALLDTVVRLTSRLTLPVAAFLIAGADPLMRLLFGARFSASGPLLEILAPIVPLGWFATYVGNALLAAGERRVYAQGLAISAAFAAIAYPVWTAAFGATGTAIASTLTVLTLALALTLYAQIYVRVMPVPAALREAEYFVIPLAVLFAVRSWLKFDSVLIPLLAAGLAIGAVELARGFPTVRQFAGLRRLAAPPRGAPVAGR